MSRTKGNIRIFFIISPVFLLLDFSSIFPVEFDDDFSDSLVDGLITEDFLGGVHEKYVQTFLYFESVFLLAVTLPDSSFEQIPFNGSFEKLLRH